MATRATARVARLQRSELLRGIYAILNEDARTDEIAQAALDGGIRVLQYRAKMGIVPERLRRLVTLARAHNALLIVNDDWRAAIAFDCDGVHLGPGDDGFDRIASLRDAIGARLIGLSCGTIEEVRAANAAGADYLGIGCVYATVSKPDAGEPIGIAGLRALAQQSAAPVAAIGGITAATVREVRDNGAVMAAIIAAIASAPDPRRAAHELVDAWNA